MAEHCPKLGVLLQAEPLGRKTSGISGEKRHSPALCPGSTPAPGGIAPRGELREMLQVAASTEKGPAPRAGVLGYQRGREARGVEARSSLCVLQTPEIQALEGGPGGTSWCPM